MEIIQKSLKLSGVEYNKVHLGLVNIIANVGLTPKEIELLSYFLDSSNEILKVNPFNTFARKSIRKKLSMSSGSMTNHISNLQKKGIIFSSDNDMLRIRDFLIPEKEKQGYRFKIERDDKK